jgi:hypothetical protein
MAFVSNNDFYFNGELDWNDPPPPPNHPPPLSLPWTLAEAQAAASRAVAAGDVDALRALILRARQLSSFLPPLSAAIAVRDAKIEKQLRLQVRVEIWKMNKWIRGEIPNVSTFFYG